MNLQRIQSVLLVFTAITSFASAKRDSNYGLLIGPLSTNGHDVSGTVYAVSDDTFFIKDFTYDGTGSSTFFWIGNTTDSPSPSGVVIPYPNSFSTDVPVLTRSNGKDVLLKLPSGVTVRSLKWLSVWCRRFAVDFGSVLIPADVDPPQPKQLAAFEQLAHGLASDQIIVLDDKTFLVPNFFYDGTAPAAFFWAGTGAEPSPDGIKVPNEVTNLNVIVGAEGQDIKVQLPGKLTVRDIDWLSVWCITFRKNFGHILIPKEAVKDVPPALGQNTLKSRKTSVEPAASKGPVFSSIQFGSCIQLLDGNLQVEWAPVNKGIVIRMSGRIENDEYMAFGVSGADGWSQMVGGDVTVAYVDADGSSFHADDYFLSEYSQCDGSAGVCPDRSFGGRNDVILLGGERRDGITTVVYLRPFATGEPDLDKRIPVGQPVNVIAAIGPLGANSLALYHSQRTGTEENIRIDFTSQGANNCSKPLMAATSEEESVKPWKPAIIQGETEFTARIGPTGGKKGYSAITGQPSWGIAWYINDLLIPEIYVEEGKTYTFIVEGGNDPTNPARYHPLYISDSPEGGYGQKSEEEQRKQKIYAGVTFDQDQFPIPTAVGSLCEWKIKTTDKSMESETFEDYKKTLELDCPDTRFSAKMTWTVPEIAGQTVYYQCYRHNHMGWKINVVKPGFRV